MLLEPAGIDRLDPLIHAINRNLLRSKSNQRTETLMRSLDCAIILHAEPSPEHPGRRDGDTPVGIGDLGQRRDKRRGNDALVEN